ncbi:MAG: response regulator [Chloroflexi bacterium]|jgi:two-component system, cell cycle response regulator DivK|nr:MAG: response regulator [Chloroflexota bacterium]
MGGELIMVVDDNPVNLKLVRVLLMKKGYEVYTATDADEALALLERVHPHLILMDIQLPGIDGLTLTRRLKADPATCDIIIVALTAYAMKVDEQKAREAGCAGYIPKPIETRTFIDTLTRLLAVRMGAAGSQIDAANLH